MLLVPWEDWVDAPWVYQKGFEVPWIHQSTDDLFVRPQRPPSPGTLSWDPLILDEEGEEVSGTERPQRPPLKDAGAEISDWLNDSCWTDVMRVRQGPLFATPIAHFFVKAFLEEPLDGFLAHLTAIEAGLGLESDRRNGGVTKCVARRISTLLGTQSDGEAYHRLFDLRSAYLHGRKMHTLSSEDCVAARRLARKIVHGLVAAALKPPCPQSREAYLNELR
jgi:hypothetical protein